MRELFRAANGGAPRPRSRGPAAGPLPAELHNEDCLKTMSGMADGSVDLVFTSPPYFNARDYSFFDSYGDYMVFMKKVLHGLHRVTAEGRFVVINTSPVLVKRESRQEKSRRYNIPAHINHLAEKEGFEFIDDIIWKKPLGAACGRIRRFEQTRSPLHYKPAPVTEYVTVYRTRTDQLPEWNIRQYDREVIEQSLVQEYEQSNVWELNPEQDVPHPAPFPEALARRVISHYSLKGDTIYDPFMGSGTTAMAAKSLGRGWIGSEISAKYCATVKMRLKQEVLG